MGGDPGSDLPVVGKVEMGMMVGLMGGGKDGFSFPLVNIKNKGTRSKRIKPIIINFNFFTTILFYNFLIG